MHPHGETLSSTLPLSTLNRRLVQCTTSLFVFLVHMPSILQQHPHHQYPAPKRGLFLDRVAFSGRSSPLCVMSRRQPQRSLASLAARGQPGRALAFLPLARAPSVIPRPPPAPPAAGAAPQYSRWDRSCERTRPEKEAAAPAARPCASPPSAAGSVRSALTLRCRRRHPFSNLPNGSWTQFASAEALRSSTRPSSGRIPSVLTAADAWKRSSDRPFQSPWTQEDGSGREQATKWIAGGAPLRALDRIHDVSSLDG